MEAKHTFLLLSIRDGNSEVKGFILQIDAIVFIEFLINKLLLKGKYNQSPQEVLYQFIGQSRLLIHM